MELNMISDPEAYFFKDRYAQYVTFDTFFHNFDQFIHLKILFSTKNKLYNLETKYK